MKTQALVCALAGAWIVEAAKERMTVTEGGIEFKVDRFDDGRSNPYRVTFRDGDGVRSIYKFSTAGAVSRIEAGSEKYKVVYKSNGDLKRVRLTSSRRGLAELSQEEGDLDQHLRRSLYACEDCVEAWDAVCDEGVPTVCALVDYGSPISDEANASIEILCSTFGRACAGSGGGEACEGQCEDGNDDGGGGTPNACLDPTSDDYKCSSSSDDAIRFYNCGLVDDDVAYFSACFEDFGVDRLETLDFGVRNGLTTLPENVFSDLANLNWIDFSGNPLVELPVGVFNGLSNLRSMYLINTDLTTLPEEIFVGLSSITSMLLFANNLVALPKGLFAPLTELTTLSLDSNDLTTLPEGLFQNNDKLFQVAFERNDMQCVPTNTAEYVELDYDSILTDGICGCTPADAVMCDDGYTCVPGEAGYTCE